MIHIKYQSVNLTTALKLTPAKTLRADDINRYIVSRSLFGEIKLLDE